MTAPPTPGSFHEAANMAALWDLPMVFVCQNNQYGEMTPTEHTMKIPQVADRAGGLRHAGRARRRQRPARGARRHCADAIDRARRGDGPTFLECVTFRFRGHYFGDPMAYIPPEQMAAAEAADPVPAFRAAPRWPTGSAPTRSSTRSRPTRSRRSRTRWRRSSPRRCRRSTSWSVTCTPTHGTARS